MPNHKKNGIHLEINEIFNNIKLSDVLTLDKSINTNFTKYSTYVDMDSDDLSIMRELIEKDISSTISRKLIKELVVSSRNEYFDLTQYTYNYTINELDEKATDDIISYIISSGYKRCILNSMVGSYIQDRPIFNFNKINGKGPMYNGADVYHIGSIGPVELYIDPYMRYDDETIILFNYLGVNIELTNTDIVSEMTFVPKLLIEFNMAFSFGDSLVFDLISSKHSKSYYKYVTDLRNKKIDNLLND
jgi:hypothetical protein